MPCSPPPPPQHTLYTRPHNHPPTAPQSTLLPLLPSPPLPPRSGLLECCLAVLPPKVLRRMFPTTVSGITVFLIGVGLAGSGFRAWGGENIQLPLHPS